MNNNLNTYIKINNLSWNFYNKDVLKNITLSIDKSCFIGIIGPNGSGKTTLLKNIAKTLTPKKSTVFIENTDILDISALNLAKKMSYVPQYTNIEFDFTVYEIVSMGRSPYLKKFQSESVQDLEIIEKSMKTTDTWALKDRNINELSGGEKQRVIIARALAQEPDIIVLDEPVSSLDIHHQIKILNILKNLVKEKNLTVIISLHDLNIASEYCIKLLLINKGKIYKFGNPYEIITKENIKEVYGIDTYIFENPLNGLPHVIPLTQAK